MFQIGIKVGKNANPGVPGNGSNGTGLGGASNNSGGSKCC